ncbi:hypothetical protein AMECASPLE_024707 [Ameca splendens]|uniref:Uncharacterized protein n=1 Tax=Ameca splendens TaxID=208324 RepID=A0ABV0YRD4_9TELE
MKDLQKPSDLHCGSCSKGASHRSNCHKVREEQPKAQRPSTPLTPGGVWRTSHKHPYTLHSCQWAGSPPCGPQLLPAVHLKQSLRAKLASSGSFFFFSDHLFGACLITTGMWSGHGSTGSERPSILNVCIQQVQHFIVPGGRFHKLDEGGKSGGQRSMTEVAGDEEEHPGVNHNAKFTFFREHNFGHSAAAQSF